MMELQSCGLRRSATRPNQLKVAMPDDLQPITHYEHQHTNDDDDISTRQQDAAAAAAAAVAAEAQAT